MGTGKTSVGRELAGRLGMEFVDMDHVIEQRAGRTISEVFADEGEPHFRSLERALVRELSARQGLVVAAGGGVVLDRRNLVDFEAGGLVVCLSAAPQTVLDRVAADTQRPLLAGQDKMGRILDLLESRREIYRAIARQVDTTGLSVEQVVERVLSHCRSV